MSENVAAKARLSGIRLSSQKTRLVVNRIRGQKVEKALGELSNMPTKAAAVVKKVLLSAVANAENNLEYDIDSLVVSTCYVNDGMKLKRFQPRAQGRAFKILKPTCHISIELLPQAS